ncbi:hypothetical protein EJ110_NYTH60230 [Nymphaea thermarum]|nr:hypothetical protein EJ110_NYTH60230 [Nymphaea thermarum]
MQGRPLNFSVVEKKAPNLRNTARVREKYRGQGRDQGDPPQAFNLIFTGVAPPEIQALMESAAPQAKGDARGRRKDSASRSRREEPSLMRRRENTKHQMPSLRQDPYKPNSLRVFGRINGHKVMILLDNGATNNFLTKEAAKRCHVPLQPREPRTIIVGGGYRLQCVEEGRDMEVVINKRTFKIDSMVIPLEGVDLILGMTWFLQWEDIRWQPKHFRMTFTP